MNFAEAWALLLEGNRIRRASWDKGFYWFLVEDVPYEKGDMKGEPIYRVTSATADELMATDWEEA